MKDMGIICLCVYFEYSVMYMGLETHLLETKHKSTIMQLNGTVRKY